MENSRNTQYMSFKLHTVLGSVMKYCAVPLHAARGANHPFAHHGHAVYATNH